MILFDIFSEHIVPFFHMHKIISHSADWYKEYKYRIMSYIRAYISYVTPYWFCTQQFNLEKFKQSFIVKFAKFDNHCLDITWYQNHGYKKHCYVLDMKLFERPRNATISCNLHCMTWYVFLMTSFLSHSCVIITNRYVTTRALARCHENAYKCWCCISMCDLFVQLMLNYWVISSMHLWTVV